MPEGNQDRSGRNRPPRVQITYDFFTDNGVVQRELPFVVGVLGNFIGHTRADKELEKRTFVSINRQDFDDIMRRMKPSLSFMASNKIARRSGDLHLTLHFNNMSDFEPGQIVLQIEPLRQLLNTRSRLRDLMSHVGRVPNLHRYLQQTSNSSPNNSHSPTTNGEPVATSSTLLEEALEKGLIGSSSRLDEFLSTRNFISALVTWLGTEFDYRPHDLPNRISRRFGDDIVEIDETINAQVNEILHHPEFQQLESAWRGLQFLVEQAPVEENRERQRMRVMVLSLTLQELKDDLEFALEFDQSALFRKIYSDHYDMPGADPIGLVIGNFEFTNHPTDIEAITKISGIVAAAFAPFIAGAHPTMMDLNHFGELAFPINFNHVFGDASGSRKDYIKWWAFRATPDARFVGLALPHVLLRTPYRDSNHRLDGFRFKEIVGKPDRSDYLWGNAAFAYAAVVIRAFLETGWLAGIRGFRPGEISGGLVVGLPCAPFNTDKAGLATRTSTDVIITDTMERELGEFGFLPLCWCQGTTMSAFHGSQSMQVPAKYDRTQATVNARISSMLHYILCVSRFSHYLKAIMRQKIGGVHTAAEIQGLLNNWLMNYVNDSGERASEEFKARYPLREASVQVSDVEGAPGRYDCKVFLRPQFQLDYLVGSIHLTPETIR